MAAHKFHIGENGPAPCRARFRACKYEVNGNSLEELNIIWEKQQEAAHADTMLVGVSKFSYGNDFQPITSPISVDEQKAEAIQLLSNRENYAPYNKHVEYEESDVDMAMKLALTNLSSFSYTPADKWDTTWSTNGCSSVQRYTLDDGSVGYFKSIGVNSHQELSFEDYKTTSLRAAINDVNAYRMAKALGSEYARMVPETVIRDVYGSIGTFQREVESTTELPDFDEDPALRQDVRRAAIFDFVIGNQDRHEENFLYTKSGEGEGDRLRIKLIDNSFSFPSEAAPVNMTVFTDNDGADILHPSEIVLAEKDLDDLSRARATVEEWISSRTIDPALGERTIDRIDYLAEAKKICSFTDYASEPV